MFVLDNDILNKVQEEGAVLFKEWLENNYAYKIFLYDNSITLSIHTKINTKSMPGMESSWSIDNEHNKNTVFFNKDTNKEIKVLSVKFKRPINRF